MVITYTMTAILLIVGLMLMLVDVSFKLKNSEHKLISVILIIATMFYVAMDCVWILEFTAVNFNAKVFNYINLIFYIVYITIPYIWFLFAQHFAIGKIKNKKFLIICAIPWAFNFVLVALTQLGLDALWIIGDSANRYIRGPLFGIFSNVDLLYYFVPVIEIFTLLFIKKNADKKTLLITLGFSLFPALGVLFYTLFISVNAIYPFQPSCFFLGVMFAYILLISQAYKISEESNRFWQEKADSATKIAELKTSMETLLNNMPAITFSKDVKNGKYIACNQKFAEYAHKKTPEGVIGHTDFEIFDKDTAEHFVKDDMKAMSMNEPYVFVETVPDAAGNIRRFQTTKLKFTDTLGRLCILGMGVDLTEIFKLEKEAENARIEKEVANAQNKAKSSFLSNISHDIRTPMNAIIGFANLASKELDDHEKIYEYLAKIQMSSEHLLSLINDVLEMSRIENGKMEFNEVPCNLSEIVYNLNALVLGQIESKQIELTMSAIDVKDENVFCDKLRVSQILLNLISNAIKYTHDNGKIEIRIIQHESEDFRYGDYEFRVKDNGIGISKEFVDKIFVAFERERTSTISGIQGTGLGLAITKKIVDNMGGNISVNTAVGKGSEFIVKLRLKLQNIKEDYIQNFVDKYALIVDNDYETCNSIAKMLNKIKMHTKYAMSKNEVDLLLKEAKRNSYSFDVFIVSAKMVNDILESIAKFTENAILLLTTFDFLNKKNLLKETNANALCLKPVFASKLYAALQKSLQGNSFNTKNKSNIDVANFNNKRVLLVEDIEINREIAISMLKLYGIKVDVATNGLEAVNMVKNAEPKYYDLIFMDVQMPIMNGYEATKEIRELDIERASVPIVAMTANAFDADRIEALKCGMNDHLTKPIDLKSITKILQRNFR